MILDEIHERSLESDLALALCLDLRQHVAARAAAAGDVRHRRRRPPRRSDGRDGHRKPRPDVPGRHPARQNRHRRAARSAGRHGPRRPRRAGRARRRHSRVPARHGGNPPHPEPRWIVAAPTSCRCTATCRPPTRTARCANRTSRRVVLATSIAETSLTVPGVRIVIDGGWRRVPRLDPSTGLTRLVTVRVSRAAADQRAGRAGREAPGVAIRLWTPAQQRGLAPFDRPEILEAELSSLVLDCAAWGTPPGEPEVPGPAAARRADRRRRVADRTWRAGRRADHAGRSAHGLARRASAGWRR